MAVASASTDPRYPSRLACARRVLSVRARARSGLNTTLRLRPIALAEYMALSAARTRAPALWAWVG